MESSSGSSSHSGSSPCVAIAPGVGQKALCVALLINSPGGMVGQSQMLHDYIAKLAKKNDKKVIAVGEDMMASGGYLIATAASRIYAPTMAAVGSIGVRQDGYDLTGNTSGKCSECGAPVVAAVAAVAAAAADRRGTA